MAEAAAAAAAAQQPVNAQFVGNAFVQQYYHILHHTPALVHKFYQNPSKLGRPEEDGSMSITTTMDAINEKILSLNYGELKAAIKSVDSQDSLDGGFHVLVTGYLTGSDDVIRNFTQTFFLAPQEKGYYVLNDMFRYIENGSKEVKNEVLDNKVVSPDTPVEAEPSVLQEKVIAEQTTEVVEEANVEDAEKTYENGEVPVVKEAAIAVAEVVVEEVQKEKEQIVAEPNTKVDEVPKKSYASLVMDWKESGVPFPSPLPTVRKSPLKVQAQQVQNTTSAASAGEVPVSNSDAVENGNNQEAEGEGYSIYIKGLPLNASSAQLEEEFKKFGPIMSDGIQIRSNRQQGVCFGFVAYEVESAVQKAIEASPVMIGGRQSVVEEKRSTNSRGNNRGGRFQGGGGRGPGGFRNEGNRGGRGNYGGGVGRGSSYGGRSDFGGRAEFSGNRGNNRGGFGGRSDGGYQRSDSMGSNNSGRNNRSGVIGVNFNSKSMPPRVPATA